MQTFWYSKMGIDIHGVNFLKYASKKKALGRVATIGRQTLMVPSIYAEFGEHGENFLQDGMKARSVDSYDFSNFEGATHIVDMNEPLLTERQYDTVFDGGCTEHIFNVSQALGNISSLCAQGGQIIHVLPANNFYGHGFWQFSPELFFSLYSTRNGYSATEVFLADLEEESSWFEVKRPKNGERANVVSHSPLYVLCRTCKISEFSHENVQQSDYVHHWETRAQEPNHGGRAVEVVKRTIKRNPMLFRSTMSVYNKARAGIRNLVNPITLSG